MTDDVRHRMAASMADAQLIATLRAGLREHADPVRAAGMRAYLKSEMPCLGVRLPQVRTLVREEAGNRPPTSAGALRNTVLVMWREASYREERYAATQLKNIPAARGLREPSLITLYEELIVSGAWWITLTRCRIG
jgi:hypothetical protein